ncbi:MAG: ribulose-phosphate 3-epimerase [Clostridiales bacterium]|nr:ribulose-phosphate 3-epimerase [Clostridiales bacterium]
MIQLVPSILAADFSRLGEELQIIEDAGVKMVHIDVMDGMFVPSISVGLPVISSIRKKSSLCFDVHLMVEDPARYTKQFAEAGADIITIHAEAAKHLHRTICEIKTMGKQVGVVLNPSTPLNVLDYVLDDLDSVLLMTVNPGFGGQDYIPQMTRKISELSAIIKERGLNVNIEVDGGIKLSNVHEVIEAGANWIVAGSAVFGKDPSQNVKEFHKIFQKYQK